MRDRTKAKLVTAAVWFSGCMLIARSVGWRVALGVAMIVLAGDVLQSLQHERFDDERDETNATHPDQTTWTTRKTGP